MIRLLIFALLLASPVQATERSQSVIREFKKLHPCPATGLSVGRCVGWQIDHQVSLCAGGFDAVWNLKWLTIEEHKAKTKQDMVVCRLMRKE